MIAYFLIPVFNEESNLASLLDNLHSAIPSYKKFYVFVDDGSTDNSVSFLKQISSPDSSVILGDGNNHGPGHAFNIGFEWILKHSQNEQDKIITLESDNTSSLGILEKMMFISSTGFDLVLASVYAQGGGFDKTSVLRKFISFCANMMFRLIFDIKVLTLSSFYRVYTVALIKKLKDKYVTIIAEKGFIAMVEILLKAIRVNAAIIEVPMTLYSSKRKGKSKMKILKTSIQYLRFIVNQKT